VSSLIESLDDLVRSAGVVFAGSIVGRVLALLGEALVVRALPPATYGAVVLAFTVAAAVATLAQLGVPDGVTRLMAAADGEDAAGRVAVAGVLLTTLGGVAAAAVVWAGRVSVASAMGERRVAGLVVLFLPYLVLFPVSRVVVGILRSRKRTKLAVLARNLVARVGALVAFGLGLWLVVYWLAAPALLLVVAVVAAIAGGRRGALTGFVPETATVRRLWQFSWPLALSSTVFLFLANMDVLLVGYFLESSSVGHYRAVQPLRQVTTFVAGSFTFLFLPIATEYVADDRFGDLDDLYKVSTKWIASATLPAVLVFTLFAPAVVLALFGAAYLPGAPALAVLTAGLYARALTGLNGDVVKAIDRPRIELFAATAAVVVNLALDLVLIPSYGIVGAAVGTAVGYLLYNLLEVAAVYWAGGSHPFDVDTVKPLVPTTGLAVALRVVLGAAGPSFIALVAVGAVLLAVQPLSVLMTRSLAPEDRVFLDVLEAELGRSFPRLRAVVEART